MLNKDYIIPSIAGRMGNNMFIVAHAYAKALQYNKQFVVCESELFQGTYDYGKNIFRKVDVISSFPGGVWNPAIPSDDQPTLYSGYFQSERYFDRYSEAIKSLFTPPTSFITQIKRELPFLFSKKVAVVSVRKGQDYIDKSTIHPTVSPAYLRKAIDMLPTVGHILVMSDEIEWCKSNIGISHEVGTSISYLEEYLPHEQMWIMSLCSHFVISNSSFSWWGAYLSRNLTKVVLAPEVWFGPDGPSTWEEMYCKGWTIVPSYYENGLILPR